ncbi:chorismate mutase [Alicyclobacillus ferrooxydans]|uniref:chorismate mutase n=1 Tax=Alicyclobacillus ferrooxydans TaxID=471514 RepID=A0A0P9GUE4_9BACL|nr:chorismate mutase [Alicyclobacillus ferrooxydans]KPV44876.1 chorismate mutase [Alicyclobacillus ferrooxydans]
MKVRGIRGATTVNENSAEAIFEATQELMREIVRQNDIDIDNVASVFLTMTQDLNADFPAKAVRSLPGWQWVPLMCAPELSIENAMKHCVRVLIHANTTRSQKELIHVYLREAVALRPDVVERQTQSTGSDKG